MAQKYEQVYLHACEMVMQLEASLDDYLWFDNQERLHQSQLYRALIVVYVSAIVHRAAAQTYHCLWLLRVV